MLLYRVNHCANWTIVDNKLLCKPTVLPTSEPKKNKLPTSEPKKNKLIDNQRDSCYSSWLIARKTILIKKNCLTCDHTTGEVLTTTNNDYHYLYANT